MPLDNRYFGEYATFRPANRDDGFALMGADNIIGDVYTIEFVSDGEDMLAWMVSRFDKRVGHFNANVSRRLNILRARGWTIRAVLSYVAFTTDEDEGYYWGEAGIIANDPRYDEAVGNFIAKIGDKLTRSQRLDIDLGTSGVDQMIAANGDWLPSKVLGSPKLEKGSAVVKDSRSLNDAVVEEARKSNPGCYVASAVLVVVLIVVIVLIIKACSGL